MSLQSMTWGRSSRVMRLMPGRLPWCASMESISLSPAQRMMEGWCRRVRTAQVASCRMFSMVLSSMDTVTQAIMKSCQTMIPWRSQ